MSAASCLRAGCGVPGPSDVFSKRRGNSGFRVYSVLEDLQLREGGSPLLALAKSSLVLKGHNLAGSIPTKKALKWWEKSVQPNMIEIQSAQHLVDSLRSFGDRLVVVHFYSPGCGGCKTLHPKICQLAEFKPNTIFLKVNHGTHKSMCYALHVHVLPFFRFYQGAEGKVCSFSCTNATIKKLKDALAKHTPEQGFLGTGKGLEDSELAALGFASSTCDEEPAGAFVGSFATA